MNKIVLFFFNLALVAYFKTMRFRFHGNQDYINRSRQFVATCWHDQLLPLVFSWRNSGRATIASESEDGALIAAVLDKWGFKVARGSTTRGGVRALIQLKKFALEDGADCGLTVDGPLGPRHVLQSGAVFLAKISGLDLVDITFSCKRYIRFNSWDKMILPLPFSKINVHASAAFTVSSDTSPAGLEADRAAYEKIMLEHTAAYSPEFI